MLNQFKVYLNLHIFPGNEIPGSIRIYGKDGCIVDLINFTPGGEFTQTTQVGSLELRGPRHTSLGTNM